MAMMKISASFPLMVWTPLHCTEFGHKSTHVFQIYM